MEKRVSNGMRITFETRGDLQVSRKIYSDGVIQARIEINSATMSFCIVDPVTGTIHAQGGNVSNFEVLQRKAKRTLKKLLPNAHFEKEKRNVNRAE